MTAIGRAPVASPSDDRRHQGAFRCGTPPSTTGRLRTRPTSRAGRRPSPAPWPPSAPKPTRAPPSPTWPRSPATAPSTSSASSATRPVSPPARFQTAVRLDRAKTLLLTTDLSVTDVCFEVGFESLGTFTRRFTAAVGLSPGRLRHLPERYGEKVDRLARLVDDGLLGPPALATPAGVVGRIVDPEAGRGPCFVGLFPAGTSEGHPVAAAVLPGVGPFRLAPVPDGRFHLLVCALPAWIQPLPGLVAHPGVRVGNAAAPVTVRGGIGAPVAVPLRAPLPTDPPLLVALPALLLEQAGIPLG